MRLTIGCALFALVILPITAAPVADAPEILFLTSRPNLPRERTEALQPLVCLRAALAMQGLEVDIDTLRAISGDAWAPLLHAEAPVREPLRDRQPLDVLAEACDLLSVESAWHTGLPSDEIIALVAAEIGDRRPLMASHLYRRTAEPAGWNLILGVEPGSGHLMLSEVSQPRRQVVVTAPFDWSGPVPGPEAWVSNPLFTTHVTEGSALPSDSALLRSALRVWAEQISATELPLATHRGARRFADADPAGISATAGAESARQLADEIAGLESLDSYPTLWRVRELLGQLSERRESAAAFLHALEGLTESERQLADEIATQCRAVASAARGVVALMWNQSLLEVTDAQDLLYRIRLDPPLVVDLNGLPAHERTLLTETIVRWPQPWEMTLHSTPWGPMLAIDSPEQRERVVDQLEQLADAIEGLNALAPDR